ncbi:MAG: glucuronate isomerase [Planctomycetota bacterium]
MASASSSSLTTPSLNTARCRQTFPGPADADWLLPSPLARRLYHDTAADLPILDAHTHLDARRLADDDPFENLADLWIASDPYKHRALRLLGVPEHDITGPASPRDRFDRWAAASPLLLGNPLHNWNALDLHRAFGITTPLTPDTADAVWSATAEALVRPTGTPRGLVQTGRPTTLCTSDRLTDNLDAHARLARRPIPHVVVRPSLRADDLLALGTPAGQAFLDRLVDASGLPTDSFDELTFTLSQRLDAFGALGATVADLGLDRPDSLTPPAHSDEPAELFERWHRDASPDARLDAPALARLHGGLVRWLAAEVNARGWSLLLHLGALRNTSTRLARLAGPAGGYATTDRPLPIPRVARLLDDLERHDALPRTVLFNLNPADNLALATLAGSFARDHEPGLVSLGPAWWFNDHLDGIDRQLDATAAHALLAAFPGMVTDARSLLSIHRHEYFRRALCRWLARRADAGELPNDADALAPLLRRMLVDNPARLLGQSQPQATTPP